ncbi:MAG: SirB2 family protein [Pseudomonadota bacterium]|nr:MAG: SirB2 family protein [Pseudomonadota bacterium]
MTYETIKLVHVSAVAVSFTGFVLRGVWKLSDSPLLAQRWVKVTPHVVDTVLLASAIWLAVLVHQYPGSHAWLTAKVIGLLGYIALGMVAMRFGTSRAQCFAAWLGALLVFGYIVAVALTRDPLPLP